MRGKLSMMNKRDTIIYFFLLFIIVGGIYYKGLNTALIWDSRIQIKQNRLIVNNTSIIKAFKYGFWEPIGYNLGRSDYYRPLTIASLILNKKLLGNSNVAFKAVNLFLFYLILIILYFYFRAQTEQKYFAEIATLIFAVFPIHINNVIWVVGRCDLLLVFWGLLSLYFLERSIKKESKKNLVLSTIFFLFALFSKESSVFFLSFFLLYEYLKRKKITVLYHIVNFIFVLFFFIIKFIVNGFGRENFHLFYPFLKNFYVFFGTLGYYFKSMIFPFDFVMLSFIKNITRISYVIWGVIIFFFLIYLLFISIKKDTSLRIPLLFIVNFLSYYVLFAYANLYPYSISTRYIIIPFIGILWLFVRFLLKIKNRVKYFILLLVILSFSFSTIYNSFYYKDSEIFWGKIYSKQKNIPFVSAVYANSLFKKKKLIEGESVLKNALKYKMRNFTAVFIGVMYAKLEYSKAKYNESLLWIKRISQLKIDNLNKVKCYLIKADIEFVQGYFNNSENMIKKAIKELNFSKELYYKLLNIYLGSLQFGKAQSLIKEKTHIFKNSINIIAIKQNFYSLTPLEKINYFIKHQSYKFALSTLKGANMHFKKFPFLYIELLYRAGDDKKAKKEIESLFNNNRRNYNLINKIAFFYLRKLSRVTEAIKYFRYSLSLHPNQKVIKNILIYLKELGY